MGLALLAIIIILFWVAYKLLALAWEIFCVAVLLLIAFAALALFI